MGALVSMQNTGARVMGVPYDEEGLDVDALEGVLARHEVKLVCVQSGSQNPTGQDMSPARAERLLQLARERSFLHPRGRRLLHGALRHARAAAAAVPCRRTT